MQTYQNRMGCSVTPAQAARLIEVCKSSLNSSSYSKTTVQYAVILALSTGARASEICSLRWDDFSHDFQRITFRRAAWNRPGIKGSRNRKQESKNWRSCRLSSYVSHLSFLFSEYSTTPWVFPGHRYHITVDHFHKLVRDFSRKVHIPFTIHGLRRYYAQQIYELTGDLTMVQLALGHSHVYVTRHYAAPKIPVISF